MLLITFPISIVAIHGLDGHCNNSWTAANGKLWLKDFLPDKIPNARIVSYGYNAYTANQRQLSDQTIYDHAEGLIVALASKRRETNASHLHGHYPSTNNHVDAGTTSYNLCGSQSWRNCPEICELPSLLTLFFGEHSRM